VTQIEAVFMSEAKEIEIEVLCNDGKV